MTTFSEITVYTYTYLFVYSYNYLFFNYFRTSFFIIKVLQLPNYSLFVANFFTNLHNYLFLFILIYLTTDIFWEFSFEYIDVQTLIYSYMNITYLNWLLFLATTKFSDFV